MLSKALQSANKVFHSELLGWNWTNSKWKTISGSKRLSYYSNTQKRDQINSWWPPQPSGWWSLETIKLNCAWAVAQTFEQATILHPSASARISQKTLDYNSMQSLRAADCGDIDRAQTMPAYWQFHPQWDQTTHLITRSCFFMRRPLALFHYDIVLHGMTGPYATACKKVCSK